MSNKHLQPDLLFCRQCRRHFRGRRRVCPSDGSTLELVGAFDGHAGDVLDQRYELLDQIGAGGMGTVFRANDRLTQRHIALKLLKAEYASNATSAQRFLQEARLVRMVSHPGVVGLHRFGRTADGTLLIDMELVEGESVRDRVLRLGSGLDVATALQVLDNLLAALAACHDAGVVHCDVKPENIMLPKGGNTTHCKLVDFGIAQVPGPIVTSDDMGVVGTPAYMSPEQVRGMQVDARTDLYLVGCVTYELLTGEPPFQGNTPLDLCHHQLLTAPPPLGSRMPADQIPEGLEAWLAALLEKSPEMRPGSARQVREALRVIRLRHRRVLSDERLTGTRVVTMRPPSTTLLRRPKTPVRGTPSPVRTSGYDVDRIRALVEVRQVQASGVVYGPEALEQIMRHVLAGALDELRAAGAEVSGPAGPHIEVKLACGGDARGAVSHLLDTVAAMHAQLSRIPEPRLEARAAVVADRPAGPDAMQGPGLDPLMLLTVSPNTQIRVDEHVARWAGRRALVRLTSVPSEYRMAPTDVYATSLHPV
jgi:serine/threonine protein kinase